MPTDIRITDLARPELTGFQRAALEFGETQTVDLSVDAVLGAAVVASGLDDFGPDDFRARLDLWVREVDEDPDRTGLGRLILFGNVVRYATNRLRTVDLLRRHPEIHDVEIARPVIVIGLPRSGTTNLVNLIGADTRFRSMPLWESYEPVPDPRETPGPDGVDPRWTRGQQMWEAMRTSTPHVAAMHPMEPDHIHEEIELQLSDFASYNQEWVGRVPRWRDHYLAHDQTPHYEWMRTGLQILQWYRPRERWVLKSPQHLEQIGPLLRVFPDATVVVTHRDPVAVVQSTATMMAYAARMSYRDTRPEWYLEYWTDRMRRLLERGVRDRHLLPTDRTLDVHFDRYMADEVGTVAEVYDLAGLALTDEARARIEAYRAAHPRGRDGRVVYDLRADFGATPEQVRAPFGFYFDTHDVRIEVR
ncbi:MAG: sulfotransferase family protein [Actinomycetota bacterium]